MLQALEALKIRVSVKKYFKKFHACVPLAGIHDVSISYLLIVL
jgi:hypothetical protein